MGKLVYVANTSLDGYSEDRTAASIGYPDEEYFSFINDLVRSAAPISTVAGCMRRWSSGRRTHR